MEPIFRATKIDLNKKEFNELLSLAAEIKIFLINRKIPQFVAHDLCSGIIEILFESNCINKEHKEAYNNLNKST